MHIIGSEKTSPFDIRINPFSIIIFVMIWVTSAFLFSKEAVEQVGPVNFTSVIRFLVLAACFSYCAFSYRIWGRDIFKVENAFLLLFLGLMLLSIFYSQSAMISFRASFTIIFVISIIYCVSNVLTFESILKTIIFTIASICFCSIAVYFLNPDMGRSVDWDGDTPILGQRLIGIIGDANTLGFLAATGVVCGFYLFHFYRKSMGIWMVLLTLISLTALIMTGSRGSMFSVVAGIGLAQLTKPTYTKLFFLCFLAVVGPILFMTVDFVGLAESTSRTSDPSDVLTGRTEIWEIAKTLIAQKPVLGWGYSSSAVVLPSYEQEIGFKTTHTHNMILQILFSLGSVGLILFLATIIIRYMKAFWGHDSFKMTLIYMIILHGMVEPSVFQGLANMDTIVFALVLAARSPSVVRARKNQVQV